MIAMMYHSYLLCARIFHDPLHRRIGIELKSLQESRKSIKNGSDSLVGTTKCGGGAFIKSSLLDQDSRRHCNESHGSCMRLRCTLNKTS